MSSACTGCGATFTREVPADLTPWLRRMLEGLPPFCARCSAGAEAEAARQDREREHRERDERLRTRREVLPATLRDLTWEQVATGHKPEVLAAARSWAAGETLGLWLAGEVGVGKTWLAAAAVRARVERGPVRWVYVPELFTGLSARFEDPARQNALEVVSGTRALVLDDLDKARATEYAAEQLSCAIDKRVTAGTQLLVTTNLEPDALAAMFPERFGNAIVSRLIQHCDAFALQGHDRRLERFAS